MSVGRVDVLSTKINEDGRGMTFDLDVFFDEYAADRRVLNIVITGDSASGLGYVSTLTDIAGNLLWEFAYQQDGQTDRHWWLTERTADDEMTIEQFATDSSFFEAYTLNGTRNEYRFNTGDVDMIKQLHADMYRNGGQFSTGQLLSADRQTMDQLTAFDNNYEWNNSLHENREGFLVAEFISSVEIAESIATDTLGGGGYGSFRTLDWDAVCAGAAVRAALKCPAGGFANPVYDTCFGVMVVCVVVKIIGSLF